MSNRVAFIDFVRGLLTINPLERWSPQQAKLHPFITQQKFTQPFVPPMNLKTPSGKPPAPGVQQQQQAEAVSKQRAAQAAQAQAQAQAQAVAQAQHTAAQSAYAMQMNQYQQPAQAPPVYNNMYTGPQQGAPPPYPTTNYAPPAVVNTGHQQGAHMAGNQYGPSQSLYAQATTRAGRQRASTMDQQQGGIPAAIQRVASHLDPNAPIRLQPSPAYYPPPPDSYADSPGSGRRRNDRAQRNRDFIRTLEDGAMQQWH